MPIGGPSFGGGGNGGLGNGSNGVGGHFGGNGHGGFYGGGRYGGGWHGGRAFSHFHHASALNSETNNNPDLDQPTPVQTTSMPKEAKIPAFIYYLLGLDRIVALAEKIRSAQSPEESAESSGETPTAQTQEASSTNSQSTSPTPTSAQAPSSTSPYTPSPRARRIAQTIAILALIQGIMMVYANIAANHVWSLFGFPFDGGIFIFVVVSAVCDTITELFHERTANRITKWCVITIFLGAIAVQLSEHLPSLPEARNINLAIALGLTTRTNIASCVAFYAGNRTNNAIYELLRRHLGCEDKYMASRFNISTAGGQAVDSLFFTFIAFGHRYGILIILKQVAIGYVGYIVIKLLTTRIIAVPITKLIRRYLDRA